MQRTIELRHLPPDIWYKIAGFLEEDGCWKRLMSVVPKNVECFEEKKYTNEHINLVAPRQGDIRLSAEIFLDEWAISGQKGQRPTLGTLLKLLVDAELFGIANYVAEILNEPPPERPKSGPAAPIEIVLPSEILNGVASYVDDSSNYPNTEDINVNAIIQNGTSNANLDFYIKYRQNDKYDCIDAAPKPAPRTYRKSERLQKQEQEHILSLSEVSTPSPTTTTTIVNGILTDEQQTKTSQQIEQREILNISLPANDIIESTGASAPASLPLVSMLMSDPKNENDASNSISSAVDSCAPLPLLSAFHTDAAETNTDRLPAISALNLGGPSDEGCFNKNVTQNNDFDENDSNCIDEDDDSLRNLESSNNDSSLTNVTGTSGDNSFELSSSSASNENIPLNVLNFSR